MATSPAKQHFEVIVIGVGSMGAAACYHLAARGHTVLGLEQFSITHDHGSHAGQSRIIRKAYFEHPDYIPLLQQAYANWEQLEALSGEKIVHRTGLFYAAPAAHELLLQVNASASLYHIALEEWDRQSALKHFPQFVLPEGYAALFEPDAGFVIPEKAITCYANLALQQGAVIHTGEKVLHWKPRGNIIEVQTTHGQYECERLIMAGGAWSAQLIPGIDPYLRVTRQVIAWLQPRDPVAFDIGRFPCWLITYGNKPGAYYGFPQLPEKTFGPPGGIKIAHHYPEQETDPDAVDRDIHPSDTQHLTDFVQHYMPSGYGPLTAAKTCLYSNSPDEHFIIDHLPGFDGKVSVAWGFSGHGFKFAAAIGEILADLAIQGRTNSPIHFLNMKRLFAGAK